MARCLLSLALAIGLGGCTHEMVLTPTDGIGPIGHGAAPAPLVSYHGPMSVDLAGKHYAGEWTMQADGGFVGSNVSLTGTQITTGSVIGVGTSGGGKAYMTEPGGGSLSCAFSFNSLSGSGLGQCRLESGKTYDLMIH